MLGFQQSAEHAKRLILEAPDNTRKTTLVLFGTVVLLCGLLYLSYAGTENTWDCAVQSSDMAYAYVCRDLRKLASCRTLAGPLRTEIALDIKQETKAFAHIVCPWENAMSELRICFALGAFLCVGLGLTALAQENRKLAELHLNASYFFSLLLGIAATFDLYAVSDSLTNNDALCNLKNEFTLQNGVMDERMDCTHDLYNLTAYVGFAACAALAFGAYQMRTWKQNLSLDGL